MYFLCYLTAGRNMAREYIHILSLGCMCHLSFWSIWSTDLVVSSGFWPLFQIPWAKVTFFLYGVDIELPIGCSEDHV